MAPSGDKREIEFLVYGEQNATNRHVVASILPHVLATSLESPVVFGKRCGYRHIQQKVEEKGSSRSSCYSEVQ